MATPSVVGRTTTPIISEPYVRFTFPSGIQLGDIAIAQIGQAGSQNLTVNWIHGWVRLGYVASGGVAYMLVYKTLNGDESGTIEDEPKDDADSITALTVIRNCGIQRGPRSASFGTTAINPDPPALTVPWTLDDPTFFQTSVVGAGSGAITGGDPDYNAGVNDSSSSGFRVVTGERIISATSQDPTAWTRASAAYVARTVGLAPKETVLAPSILRIDSFYADDSLVHDYSLKIPAGPNRSLFVWASSNATQIVLDPSGLNLTMSVVSDGTTTADTPGATDNLYGAWFTIDPDLVPPAGTYTLRYNPANSSNAQLFVICLGNASRELQASQVVKFWHVSSAQDQDFNIDVAPDGGILLWVARRGYAGGFIVDGAYAYGGTPPNTCTSDSIAVAALREIHANSSMHAALFARQYGPDRGGDTIANRVRLFSAAIGGYLAISIGYAPLDSANALYFAQG